MREREREREREKERERQRDMRNRYLILPANTHRPWKIEKHLALILAPHMDTAIMTPWPAIETKPMMN
jgi:hypothetical protein